VNLPQRIAVLLALGVLLHISGTAILFDEPSAFVPHGPRYGGATQAVVVAVHIAAWTAAALYLLRDRDDA
jgi:hypothetical protein